jgi:hypothetical protein
MAERIIEHYQEAIVDKKCDAEEGLVLEDIRKNTDDELCEQKGYIRKGYRREERGIKTEFGEVRFRIEKVECKGCGRIFTPIIEVLKIGKWERKSEGSYDEDS